MARGEAQSEYDNWVTTLPLYRRGHTGRLEFEGRTVLITEQEHPAKGYLSVSLLREGYESLRISATDNLGLPAEARATEARLGVENKRGNYISRILSAALGRKVEDAPWMHLKEGQIAFAPGYRTTLRDITACSNAQYRRIIGDFWYFISSIQELKKGV